MRKPPAGGGVSCVATRSRKHTKRRQIMLVQVVKVRSAGKKAPLTTLFVAGRTTAVHARHTSTCARWVSKCKITTLTDRKRLRAIVSDLDVLPGMGLIVRIGYMPNENCADQARLRIPSRSAGYSRHDAALHRPGADL